MTNNDQILQKLDALNNNLEIQKLDKENIKSIKDNIDDIKITLQELKTISEYQTVNSKKNSQDIDELKRWKEEVEVKLSKLNNITNWMMRFSIVFLSVWTAIFSMIIKKLFF